MEKVLEIINGAAGNPQTDFAQSVNLCIYKGEQFAIIGDNAAGKTRLVESLTGKNPLKGEGVKWNFGPKSCGSSCSNIRYIAFQDTYGDSTGHCYLQQRWNQMDIDTETPTVESLLDKAFDTAQSSACLFLSDEKADELLRQREELREELYDIFAITPMLSNYIISLSSGEMRKFQLTKALLAMPRVLILDNPFIGLDAPTRELLSKVMTSLVEKTGIMVVPVMTDFDTIPSFITHIVPVEGLTVGEKVTVNQYLKSNDLKLYDSNVIRTGTSEGLEDNTENFCDDGTSKGRGNNIEKAIRLMRSIPVRDPGDFYPTPGSEMEIINCRSVSIRYGERTILQNVNWRVLEGEKWALFGSNGAGKSTLLSLVCADNPQSYACDISLFSHPRGSGETIWDIKRHIGYVSPEMQRSYLHNIECEDIVASGLFDTVGLFMTPGDEQLRITRTWMDIFGIGELAHRMYLKVSGGEQRLCLLARAFVKDPELLILDEPMHGLDAGRKEMVRSIIDEFVSRPHKTLVMVTHFPQELPSCIDHRITLTKH